MQSIQNNANLLSNADKCKRGFFFLHLNKGHFLVTCKFLFCGSLCHVSHSKQTLTSSAISEKEAHDISFTNFPLKNLSLFRVVERTVGCAEVFQGRKTLYK